MNYNKGKDNPFWGKTHSKKVRNIISKNTSKSQTGKKSKNWKGGVAKACHGYLKVYVPNHPFAVHGYVLQHRLVAESIVNRILSIEDIVHHINGLRNDNRIENLMVLTRSEHCKLHHELRKSKSS